MRVIHQVQQQAKNFHDAIAISIISAKLGHKLCQDSATLFKSLDKALVAEVLEIINDMRKGAKRARRLSENVAQLFRLTRQGLYSVCDPGNIVNCVERKS
jgi:hypothetical protein